MDAGIVGTTVKPVHHSSHPTAEDNEDSFSNALLNESFDSLSDIQRSFSTEESDTFSLSDPVSSPVFFKPDDISFMTIAIPKLQTMNEDEADSYGELSPVQILYKLNRCSSPTTTKDETMPYNTKRPSSVTTVSYGAPETPAPWSQPESHSSHSPVMSNPYRVIRSASAQLAGLKYTLSCVNKSHLCPVVPEPHGSMNSNRHDVILGTRRVEAAVCAFGGLVSSLPKVQPKMSIFRDKSAASTTQYERALPSRFTIRHGRISWDVEEHPPMNDDDNNNISDEPVEDERASILPDKTSPTEHTRKRTRTDGSDSSSHNRCQLCGQQHHHHNCPHQPSVQRSIGVMVYPVAHSYTASDPGSDDDRLVTPEVPRVLFHSSPESSARDASFRSHSRRPFVACAVPLEQFRAIVTPVGAYAYPPIPLTFQERKSLSDTLFLFTRQIPHMTEQVAVLLNQARHEWDQGTAELLTQVVIGLFCVEGDARLDGLHRYLLCMGISC